MPEATGRLTVPGFHRSVAPRSQILKDMLPRRALRMELIHSPIASASSGIARLLGSQNRNALVMKNIRPLFLRQLDVQLPGLRIRRLRLNRHLPETMAVRPHEHDFAQVLLYLGGRGLQQIGAGARAQSQPIRTGTVVFLPPGQVHAFTETESRRPLCLVVDLDWRGASKQKARLVQLNQIDLSEVRQRLSQLGRYERGNVSGAQLRIAGLVLQVVDTLFGALGLIDSPSRAASAPVLPVVGTVQRLLATAPESQTLRELAGQLGYQQDYLNRVLKSAAGLTLGQMRSQARVTRAKRLLRETRKVSDVAAQLGFRDANYFARWFRLQTGQTPRQWKSAGA